MTGDQGAPNFQYLAFGPETGPVTSLVVMLHGYGRNALYMQKMAEEVRARLPQAMALCVHGPQTMDVGVMRAAAEHHLHIPQEVVEGNDGNPPEMMREWFRIDGDRDALHPRLSKSRGTSTPLSTRNGICSASQKSRSS